MSSLLARIRFRLDHRWTPHHLSEFVDDDMPPRSRTRLQRHVDQCPDCNRALVTLQRLIDRLHRLPPTASNDRPDIASQVRRRIEADVSD
jgi:anti-sigma factor RsiW